MPFPLGAALGGLTGLATAFGTRRPTSPYAGQINQATDNLRGLYNTYGQQAGMAGSDDAYYRSRAAAATQGFADYLRRYTQDPTATQRSAYVGRQTAQVESAYQSGASSLASALAQRGVTDSSATSGGLAALAAQRAGAVANASSQANQYFDTRQADAYNQLGTLYGNAENQAYARQQQALGQQNSVNTSLLNLYEGQQSQWAQQQDTRYTGFMNLLGALSTIPELTLGRKTPPTK